MTVNPYAQKKGFFLLLTLLLFVLSGCASKTYWEWEHKDHLDRSILLADRQECQKIARREADRNDHYYLYHDYLYYWPYDRWGRYYVPYRGWYLHSRFMRYQDDLERFFSVCMKAKGWTLVKKVRATDDELRAEEKKSD